MNGICTPLGSLAFAIWLCTFCGKDKFGSNLSVDFWRRFLQSNKLLSKRRGLARDHHKGVALLAVPDHDVHGANLVTSHARAATASWTFRRRPTPLAIAAHFVPSSRERPILVRLARILKQRAAGPGYDRSRVTDLPAAAGRTGRAGVAARCRWTTPHWSSRSGLVIRRRLAC